ncbi:hypothetical protein ACA910_008545 [Epithemia clementina (nom. ined.)]
MRAPPAVHHHHRTRMVVVENVTKPTSHGEMRKNSFPRHQRVAQFTARVAKPSTLPNDERNSFQPVNPDPGTDDDDFALEDLEEASHNHVDSFDQQEFDYHDIHEQHAEAGEGMAEEEPSQVVSDSDDNCIDDAIDLDDDDFDENVVDDNVSDDDPVDDEVSTISQKVSNNNADVPQSQVLVQSESPTFSDSGSASAFTPTNAGSRTSPAMQQRVSVVGHGRNGGPSPSPKIHQVESEGEDQPVPKPSNPSQVSPVPSAAAPVAAAALQPRTTVTVSTTTPPGLPKARITVQTTTPPRIYSKPRQIPLPPPTSRPNQGTFTPVASNLGEIVGLSAAKLGRASSNLIASSRNLIAKQQDQSMDATPIVSNGRKVIITPESSPNRSADNNKSENGTDSSQQDWSKSAVDKVTNAVGTLARIGHSFLQGPIQPQQQQKGQAHDQMQMPQHPISHLNEQTNNIEPTQQMKVVHPAPQKEVNHKTAPTPLHPPTIQQQQGHFHPPLHQYMPAIPDASPQMFPGSPSTSLQGPSSSSSTPQQRHLPHGGQGTFSHFDQDTSMSQQQVQAAQNSWNQHSRPPNNADGTESALSSALDKMNLDDLSSSLGEQPLSHDSVFNKEFKDSSYLPISGLQQDHVQSSTHHPRVSDIPSIYGPSQSQTGTEHMSNQKSPSPMSAKLAASLMSTARGSDPGKQSNVKTTITPQSYTFRAGKGYDISPMMRMRHSELATNDYQSVNSNSAISRSQSILSQSVQSQSLQSQSAQSQKSTASQMTEEEFHAMKQRKWKEKKKLADKTRAREKERLEGTSKKKSRGRVKRKRMELDSMGKLGVCHSGLQNILSNLMEGSCGQIEDGSESEEDEESTLGESTEASEDYTRGSSARSSIQSSRHQADSPSRVSSKISNARTEEESLDQTETVNDGATTDGSRTEGSRTEESRTEGSRTEAIRTEKSVGAYQTKIDMDKLKDKAFIKQFTLDVSTTGIRFFYHKEATSTAMAQPRRVLVRLQLGSQGVNGKFSGPCLVISSDEDEFVLLFDLFDIRTLEKASATKLKAYPLSLPGNSVLVRLSEGDHVFEAPNEEAAARFVHGMRWLIARLSFNLIIGNASVSSELLEPVNSIPDEMLEERAMNDVSNHLADKTTQFVTV